MSIELSKCKECHELPTLSWVVKGGDSFQNVWKMTTLCQDCWAVFAKKCDEGLDAQIRAEACNGRF